MNSLIDDLENEIKTIRNSRIEHTKAHTITFISIINTLTLHKIITQEQRIEIFAKLENVLQEKVNNIKINDFTF